MSTLSLIRYDETYFVPSRPVIKIKTIDGEDTLLEYNGFDINSADMIVVSGSAERAKQEIGTGTLVIEDSDQTLTKDHIQAARVEMSFGKDEDHLSHFLAWNSETMEVMRPQNFSMQYNLSGPGSKVKASELLLLVRKSTKTANNPDYGIGNIILDMIHKRKSTPLNEKDIDELWAVSADLVSQGGLISDDLNKIFYTVINEVFTSLYDFIERMAAISGAEWDTEYDPDFKDILSFQYPPSLNSGIRVKSVDLASTHDNKKKTSYILGPFSIKYDSSSDAGVKTDLFTTTVIDSTVVSSQMSAPGFTSLTNKAIAQQFEIDNGDRRIVDLAFILSRLGTVSSPKNQINCDLVLDDSANRPLGPVLATFKIPLEDIKTSPRTIFVNDVDVKIRFLQGTNKVWVRMFQRSSDGDSDPNTDELNTIRWHHNNDFATGKALYSATAVGGDYKIKEQLLWNPRNDQPTYTYSVFSKINRLLSIRNQTAAKRIGTKQMYIDTSQISTEPGEIFRYLTFLLQRMSKPRISTSPFKATIPTQFIFKPLQGVSFEDSFSNTFLDLQVQRARIAFDAKSSGEDTSIMGAYHQEITLGGSQNLLTGDCSCS